MFWDFSGDRQKMFRAILSAKTGYLALFICVLFFLSGCIPAGSANTDFFLPSVPKQILPKNTSPVTSVKVNLPRAEQNQKTQIEAVEATQPKIAPTSLPTASPIPSQGTTNRDSSQPIVVISSSPPSVAPAAGGNGVFPSPIPQATLPPPGLHIITGVFIQGQNIMGASAPAALHANYLGKVIQLSIQGYFYLGAAQPEDVDVYLDNDIETNTLSVSNNRIEASFNTANIPDLYLVGSSHTLTLDLPGQTLKVEIRVGAPDVTVPLAPQIQQIEVVRDEFDEVEYLQIKGTNLMYNPNFAQVKVNQEVVSIIQAGLEENEQEQEEFIMLIDPPQNSELTKNTKYSFSYTTPFGVAFQEFVAN